MVNPGEGPPSLLPWVAMLAGAGKSGCATAIIMLRISYTGNVVFCISTAVRACAQQTSQREADKSVL
jgi:hypothetical protein